MDASVNTTEGVVTGNMAARWSWHYLAWMSPISDARHQFPPVVNQHTIGLYLRFALSDRDVEKLLRSAASLSLTNPADAGW